MCRPCRRSRAGDVDELLAACDELDLEGVVLERDGSRYRPGRSRDWRKVKTTSWRSAPPCSAASTDDASLDHASRASSTNTLGRCPGPVFARNSGPRSLSVTKRVTTVAHLAPSQLRQDATGRRACPS